MPERSRSSVGRAVHLCCCEYLRKLVGTMKDYVSDSRNKWWVQQTGSFHAERTDRSIKIAVGAQR